VAPQSHTRVFPPPAPQCSFFCHIANANTNVIIDITTTNTTTITTTSTNRDRHRQHKPAAMALSLFRGLDDPLSLRSTWDPVADMWPVMNTMNAMNAMSPNLMRTMMPSNLGACDVVETDKALNITMDAPGMTEEDLKVQLSEGVLTISGEVSVGTWAGRGEMSAVEGVARR